MTAKIFAFALRQFGMPSQKASGEWLPQDLAELYRIRDQLSAAGLSVKLTTGQTDENEPWASFEHSQTGEVFVHIAKLDQSLVVVNAVTFASYKGADFRSLADQMLGEAPLSLSIAPRRDSKISIHPRSVFVAFIAATMAVAEYVHSMGKAHAAEVPSPEAKAAMGRDLFGGVMDRVFGRDVSGNPIITASASLASILTIAAGAFAVSRALEEQTLKHEAHVSEVRLPPQEADVLELASASMPNQPKAEPIVLNDTGQGEPGQVEFAALPLPSSTKEMVQQVSLPLEWLSGSAGPMNPSEDNTTARSMSANESVHYVEHRAARGTSMNPGESDDRSAQVQRETHTVDKQMIASMLELTTFTNQELRAIEAVLFQRGALDSPRAPLADTEPSTGGSQVQDGRVQVGQVQVGQVQDGNAARAIIPQELNQNILIYFAPTESSFAVAKQGRTDIIVFSNHDVTVTNFRFGEDLIFANGSLDRTDWIKSIDVVSHDVIISGIHGGRVTLIDAFPTIA